MKSLFFGLLYIFFSHSDTLLLNHSPMDVKSYDKQQKMQKLIDYLEQHYQERIAVAELAVNNREAGMSYKENAEWLREHANNINYWFKVEDLMYLKRGGRVSAA